MQGHSAEDRVVLCSEWNPENTDALGGGSGRVYSKRTLQDPRGKVSNCTRILRCNSECGLGLPILVLKTNPKPHTGLPPGRLDCTRYNLASRA